MRVFVVGDSLLDVTFQPMLLNLPSPLPLSLVPRWTYVDDDEFGWRVFEEYGDASVVKLRYIIAKFDIGTLAGFSRSYMEAT